MIKTTSWSNMASFLNFLAGAACCAWCGCSGVYMCSKNWSIAVDTNVAIKSFKSWSSCIDICPRTAFCLERLKRSKIATKMVISTTCTSSCQSDDKCPALNIACHSWDQAVAIPLWTLRRKAANARFPEEVTNKVSPRFAGNLTCTPATALTQGITMKPTAFK